MRRLELGARNLALSYRLSRDLASLLSRAPRAADRHLSHCTRTNMAPGERSEEVHLWYTAVYEAVQEIPHGKVTSYGHIARLLGKREHCLSAT
jgi:O6-methylguanine-DNA--protein-cysteine methyltransferase